MHLKTAIPVVSYLWVSGNFYFFIKYFKKKKNTNSIFKETKNLLITLPEQ